MPERIFVAVAWPYTNGPRHLGHVAGSGVPSDVFARYHRFKGNDVLMVSGTDEHGTPNLIQADAEGLTPKQAVDKYSRIISEDLRSLGLSYDLFTRTTTQNHRVVVQDVFKTLYDKRYLIKKTAMGAFQAATGRTLPDRYIEGTCPICGFPSARGDQCDNCGNQLDPDQLINPRSKINGETPIFVETEHFFLDLPAFADALAKWLDTRDGWRPNVLRFSKNLVSELQPRAITRDLEWGVPVPLDGWRDRADKRIYVWFDAVIGYLSASIEWARRSGADALRYFIAVAGPESQDTDFTWAEFLRRNNDELVAGWGNLVNRSISMAAKNFGAIPPAAALTATDEALLAATRAAFGTVGDLIGKHRQKAAISEAMRVVGDANKYFSECAPWKLKDDPVRMGTVLHVALQAVSDLNTLLTPFLPHAAQRIHELLGGTGVHAPMPSIVEVSDLDGGPDYPILTGDYSAGARWESVPLSVGRELAPPTPVFRKLDPSIVEEELARLGG